MESGSTRVRVRLAQGGGWEVVEPGTNGRVLARSRSQEAALTRGRARLVRGGVVEVVDTNNELVNAHQVPEPGQRPWWYCKPSVAFLVIPPLLLLQGVLGVLIRPVSNPLWWFALLVGLLGAIYVATFVLSRLRDRQRRQAWLAGTTRER